MKLSIALLVLVVAALMPATTHAQGAPLDRVQNMITTGRFTEAERTLTQWEQAHADARSDASAADRARALYLRGVLTEDAQKAEDTFIAVVLGYPSSAVAPQALLRLGQALLTAGDTRRAIAYLERLRSDYPGSPARETGMLWLARAQHAAGNARQACTTASDGARDAADSNLRTLLEIERERTCDADTAPATSTRTVQEPPRTEPPRTEPAPAAANAATGGRYAVQTAAFRELSSAETVAGQLRARGIDARVVTVEGSTLYRVRHGVFESSRAAAAAVTVVRGAGFAAIIVNDARNERLVHNAARR